jgi:MOSC domain-containing protein
VAGTVAWISIAPVKGLALAHPPAIRLERDGVAENRRFYLVDSSGRLLNGKRLGRLVQVAAHFDKPTNVLELRFPDGTVTRGDVAVDGAVETSFYGRPVQGRVLVGPWAEALSSWSGLPVQIVCPDRAGDATDRGRGAGVTLVSTAALQSLADAADSGPMDGRRFRMLFGVDGIGAHEGDGWVGGCVRIGDATVELLGNVGRCAVTTQNPDTGVPDLDTLRVLGRYRAETLSSEPLPFGVWGTIVEPGRVGSATPSNPSRR